MPTVTVTTELTDSQAMALAQFVKRLTWSEMWACAVDDDETWVMKDASSHCRNHSLTPVSVLADYGGLYVVLMYYIRTT